MKSPIKWAGGKYYLADEIVSLFPPRNSYIHYVEPFAGSLAVLFAHNPINKSEVINDLHGSLMMFYTVLQDKQLFEEFHEIISLQLFSEESWQKSCEYLDNIHFEEFHEIIHCCDPVKEAIAFFICCRQSRGGMFKDFATLSKNRTRRCQNEQTSAWWNSIDGLPEIHQRLSRVVIYNCDAIKIIKMEDSSNTLFYIDCPYLHETRVCTDLYAFEMQIEDHEKLLNLLKNIKGRFLLSSYPNKLYDSYGWRYKDFIKPKASGGCVNDAIERVYMNY